MTKSLYVTLGLFFLTFTLLAQNSFYNNSSEASFRRGLELLEKNQFGSARKAFEEYIEELPEGARKADAYYYRAYSALNLFHSDGEKLIQNFIRDFPDHPKAVLAYYELGNFWFGQKKYKQSIRFFEKVPLELISEAQRAETRFKLGYAHFASKDFDNALPYFNVLKRQNSDYTAASNYYAGYIEYEKGENQKAITDLQEAEENEAYKAVVPAMLANLYYKEGDYDRLLAYSNQVLSSGTRVNERDFYLLSADANAQKKNYSQAVEFYELYAESLSKVSPEIEYRIGLANYNAGNLNEAIEHFKQAASDRDKIGILSSYYLGILYLKQDNKLYAVTAFDNARRNNFDPALAEESTYQYAKVCYDLGRAEEAIEGFNTYLNEYENGVHRDEVSDLLSTTYLDSRNYNLAIEHIEKQGSIGKTQQEIYQKATFLKGVDLFNKKEYAKAVETFSKSLKYPLDLEVKAQAALWIGEAYAVGRKYEQSIEYYQVALGTNLTATSQIMLDARYGIAYAYYNTKVYDRALVHFKEYVARTAPDDVYHADAVIRLADCYYVNKRYAEALQTYKKAISVTNTDVDYAHLQTGIVQGLQNNYDEAIREYDIVITNFPNSRYADDAMYQKGQLAFENGFYDKSTTYFTTLITTKRSSRYLPYALLRRASSYYNLADYDKSIQDYKRVLKEYPSHSVAKDALLPLQEVLALENRTSEFDAVFTNYKNANPNNEGLENVEFEAAKNSYYSLNYQKAIDNFRAFISAYPQSAQLMEARYFIAESYYRLGELDQALEQYNYLLTQNNFNQRSRVANRIADIEYTAGRFENALYFYDQLLKLAGNKKEEYYAWAGMMESHFAIGNYDSVKYYANVILERGKVNIASQNKASLFLGKAAYARGDFELAKDEFLNTLNTARDEHGAEAQYLLGELFYQQKEYTKSIEALIELNNNFNPYESWVGKAYLLLADNYIALDDVFQAKGTLRSVVENFPLENVRAEAQRRLDQLEKTEDTNETDTLINQN